MKKEFISTISKETKKLGEILAGELAGGAIICLLGDLGSGKTTFAQGLLKGLKVKGPYTSPTFLVMKHYKKRIKNHKSQTPNKSQNTNHKIQNIYHIDAYRVNAKDIINLGWEEIIVEKNNVIIVEWADRIKRIIPKNCIWVKFEWLDKEKRKIIFNN